MVHNLQGAHQPAFLSSPSPTSVVHLKWLAMFSFMFCS